MPAMTTFFHTNPAMVRLTLASFLLTAGFSQLIIGPVSDRIGLKRTLNIGLTLYLVATLLCTLCKNINLLIVYRLIQGVGAASASTSAKILLTDNFFGKSLKKSAATMSTSWATGTIIAPAIGGYIQQHFY